MSILSDAAVGSTRDYLSFERYTDPLIEILSDPNAETPFTVGIFGAWGSGKSSLLQMLDEKLEAKDPKGFVRVHFNPWVYRGEKNILIPLLHTLQDTLEEDVMHRFTESAKKIGDVLLRLGADVLLKRLTADSVSLEKLEKLEAKYLEHKGQVESQIRKLRLTLQAEADNIAAKGARLVFFVDDLDRCEPEEIINLLESIKLFLDLKNVFVVLAVDKEVIDRGIEVKYSAFQFEKSRKLAVGAEYIEKMVQLPLQLYPLHKKQILWFMNRFGPGEAVKPHLSLLESIVLPNPRKIKRILNILAVSSHIADQTQGIENLDRSLLARLAVLQVQAGDLYSQIVRMPDALFAFDGLAADPPTFDVHNPGTFARFGARRDAIVQLCKDYYRPESFLSALFRGDEITVGGKKSTPGAFSNLRPDDLSMYLSMLGA
ncbi:KAP family P-loop NTPase fold protein [Terriglobus roseus]|uniref:KAP family P-loop NTPase fold protein n=1 Tax=Terriglobus roseus TaxID=392734 RepID=UPI00155FB710|nr:P-loop NTPase fold protein [Terriglobus roseus]